MQNIIDGKKAIRGPLNSGEFLMEVNIIAVIASTVNVMAIDNI